jgi:hypothetical protein
MSTDDFRYTLAATVFAFGILDATTLMGVGCKNSRTSIDNEPVSCGSSIHGIAQRPVAVRRGRR